MHVRAHSRIGESLTYLFSFILNQEYVMAKVLNVILAVVVLAGFAWVFSSDSVGQVKKGKSRVLTTKQWMQAVHKVHCGALKKTLEAGPADDKAWAAVATHAGMLNESGFVLMSDGRCPDGVWAGAVKKLKAGSEGVAKAAGAKDLDAARASFKILTQSCGACHKAHKK